MITSYLFIAMTSGVSNVALRDAHRNSLVGMATKCCNATLRFYVDVERLPTDYEKGDVVSIPKIASKKFLQAHSSSTIRRTMRRQRFATNDNRAFFRRDYYAEILTHATKRFRFDYVVVSDDDGILCAPQTARALATIHPINSFFMAPAYFKYRLSGFDQSFALFSGSLARRLASTYWNTIRPLYKERSRDVNFNAAIVDLPNIDFVVPPTCPQSPSSSNTDGPWRRCAKQICQPTVLHVHDAASVARALTLDDSTTIDVCRSGLVWLDKVKSPALIRSASQNASFFDNDATTNALKSALLNPRRRFTSTVGQQQRIALLPRSDPSWCPYAHSVIRTALYT